MAFSIVISRRPRAQLFSGASLTSPTSVPRWAVVTTSLLVLAACANPDQQQAFECPTTPLEDRLPTVIAPMAGSEPIWLVDASFGHWLAEEKRVTVIWVLSRPVGDQLVVRGRRLDEPIALQFQDPTDEKPTERLVIPNPGKRSVIPGGSTREILGQYAFVMTHVIYPSPGCWEITARLGDDERRIVVEVTEQREEA